MPFMSYEVIKRNLWEAAREIDAGDVGAAFERISKLRGVAPADLEANLPKESIRKLRREARRRAKEADQVAKAATAVKS